MYGRGRYEKTIVERFVIKVGSGMGKIAVREIDHCEIEHGRETEG